MIPKKPYLIRAIYQWLLDNDLTPYLLANTNTADIKVPRQYINNDMIILNIAPNAVADFHADNEWISFSARFSGKAMELFIPVIAVQAVYGKENNEGMFFNDGISPPPLPPEKSPPPKQSTLKVVK